MFISKKKIKMFDDDIDGFYEDISDIVRRANKQEERIIKLENLVKAQEETIKTLTEQFNADHKKVEGQLETNEKVMNELNDTLKQAVKDTKEKNEAQLEKTKELYKYLASQETIK